MAALVKVLRNRSLRPGKVLSGCLLIAYLSATSFTSWTDDPANIERWPLPVVGSGTFQNLAHSSVRVVDSRVAVRVDLWSIDSMSDSNVLEFRSGIASLNIRQEYGSLYIYMSSPERTYRLLILPEIKSGKNEILFVFEKSNALFSFRNDLSQNGTLPFTLSEFLYFSASPSLSTLLYPGGYGSIHLRVSAVPNKLESNSLITRFGANSQTRAIAFDAFLLFLGLSILAKLTDVIIKSRRLNGTSEKLDN